MPPSHQSHGVSAKGFILYISLHHEIAQIKNPLVHVMYGRQPVKYPARVSCLPDGRGSSLSLLFSLKVLMMSPGSMTDVMSRALPAVITSAAIEASNLYNMTQLTMQSIGGFSGTVKSAII